MQQEICQQDQDKENGVTYIQNFLIQGHKNSLQCGDW